MWSPLFFNTPLIFLQNDVMDITPRDNARRPEYNIIALMRTSVIVASVMLLKAHLKTLYSLSEEYASSCFLFIPSINRSLNCSKCNKFVIGKKSAVGDKPAIKRHDKPISWDRLPFATNPLHTTHDAEVQKAKVRCLSSYLLSTSLTLRPSSSIFGMRMA